MMQIIPRSRFSFSVPHLLGPDAKKDMAMEQCSVCGATLTMGSRTCPLCGTTAPEPVQPSSQPAAVAAAPPNLPQGILLAAGTRLCPGCGKTYGSDYADTFCTCGMELYGAEQLPVAIVEDVSANELPAGLPMAEVVAEVPGPAPMRPPAGTRCLVLYNADKQPIQYFPLTKDAVLIGRLDAVAGTFPDIDVAEWLDAAQVRKVSRKHALVLRVRATGAYFLRPLVGNTGTQVDTTMAVPLTDYPLEPGRRIILGGAVRFKFEIA